MTYFMFVHLRPRRNDREQFQRKEGCSVDFHAILKKKPPEQAYYFVTALVNGEN